MPKFMIPHHYEPSAVSASIDLATPTMGEITFLVENQWHIYHLDSTRSPSAREVPPGGKFATFDSW
jgi:hypothetical protein